MSNPRSNQPLDGMIISDTSIRQPVLITMLMLLTVVLGLLAFNTMPVDLVPDLSVPVVTVTVPYPGAGPESVAEQVARPLENGLNTLSGVRHITTIANEGVAVIAVEFDTSVDIDQAEQHVREQVNSTLPLLPADVLDPTFQRVSTDSFPILSVAVSGAGRSGLELRQLVDDQLVPQLQRIQGVGSVLVGGGQRRQINVQMDLARLKALQVLPGQISQSIQTANTDQGLGSVRAGSQELGLRAAGLLKTPADIEGVPIAGTPYLVGDVASIEDGIAEPDTLARLDGQDAVTIGIRKQSGANTLAVAEQAKHTLDTFFAGQPGTHYAVAFDQSTFVEESTNGAIEEMIAAVIAALLVVLLFFRDLRNTLVTVAGLPVILIGTFGAISLFGQTINIFTLLALSLSVGLVIDDAIVVRENIFRHMERGESPFVAASRGTAQVTLSVLAMSLTIIAVFLPTAFTGGIIGALFGAFGITVACAMAISLVEALTLAPMLSAYFFKQKKSADDRRPTTDDRRPTTDDAELATDQGALTSQPRSPIPEPRRLTRQDELLEEARQPLDRSARLYERALQWSLRRRMLIVGVAVLVLMLSFVVAGGLQFAFLAPFDRGEFAVGFEMPAGTALDETDRMARRAEEVLMQDAAVESVLTTVGGVGTPEHTEFFVKLHKGQPNAPNQERLRELLSFLPQLSFSAESSQTSGGTAVTGRMIQVSIQSPRSLDDLGPLVAQVQDQVRRTPGTTDVDTTYRPGKPELRFTADNLRLNQVGLNNDLIASSVRALIDGDKATTLRQGGQDTEVFVRLRPGDRATVEDLRGISVPTAQGGSVPLSSLAKAELTTSPGSIRRYDRMNQIVVGANVVGRNVAEVQGEIAAQLAGLGLPSDVAISFIGESEQLNEGVTGLLVAMGLSVLFVYMVLASQFGSFAQPLVIMLAMPFSFIGAFLALRIVGLDLDMTGLIGLIMLLGLVTKNSILLVDFANQLRQAGMDKHDALARAGAIRLRPILMTTMALVAGSLPVAIGFGEGTELRRSLSVVVIGGLLTSMVLTLLVVPTAYSLLESLKQRLGGLLRRRPRPAADTQPQSTNEFVA